MPSPLLEPVPEGAPTLFGAPCADLEALAAPFAALGAPFGVPYTIRNVHYGASDAPAAVRASSARFGRMLEHYDLDLGGTPFDGKPWPIVDLGDVAADPRDLSGNARRVTEAVAGVVARGAVPIVLGGDDSISALAIRGGEQAGPLTVVQIDAHIDFRDEVGGERGGYSSPMRRASEMAWVERIVHVGTRGLGSARPRDVEDTLAAGNVIITAREVREKGIEHALGQLREQARYYVVLDCDGLDPSVAPGTSVPSPGGLLYQEAADLFVGLAQRGRIVGMNVAEHYPALDVNGITSLVIARLIAIWIGTAVRQR
jgi:agmatinase